MKNVEMKVEGNILTIKVDLTKDFGPSSSGKDHYYCIDRRKMSPLMGMKRLRSG